MTPAPTRPARVFTCALPSRLDAIDGMSLALRTFLGTHGDRVPLFATELLVRECVNNAVIHGNRCNPARRVRVGVGIGRVYVRIDVTDAGRGFDWRRHRRRPLPGLTATSGRGMPLLRSFADRVRFNTRGNHVTLWVRLARKETPSHGRLHR
jgi:serine/threonine-protein kinase RsbW